MLNKKYLTKLKLTIGVIIFLLAIIVVGFIILRANNDEKEGIPGTESTKQNISTDLVLTLEATGDLTDENYKAIKNIILKRLDILILQEASMDRWGKNQIKVSARDVKDVNQIRYVITAVGKLEYKKVDVNLTKQFNEGTLKTTQIPPEKQLMYLDARDEKKDGRDQDPEEPYVVDRQTLITNEDIKDSTVVDDPYARPQVQIRFTETGARSFEAITEEMSEIGKKTGEVQKLATIVDNQLINVGTIKQKISTAGIVIAFPESTRREQVREMAAILQPKALPFELRIIDESRYLGGQEV